MELPRNETLSTNKDVFWLIVGTNLPTVVQIPTQAIAVWEERGPR